ncbi:uncharacterized protein EI90DRAFT_2897581, partial [Cantharellus anzutake]|uniref:uncharacterized protein n=1 Tax=Cantharellus anzutake TaxID=1750568 RepID=UPI0019059B04
QIKEVNVDSNKMIYFLKLLEMLASKMKDVDSESKTRKAFEVFTPRRTTSPLCCPLRWVYIKPQFGLRCLRQEVEGMIEETDVDGDGRLIYD